ncbi:MAG TPA: RICIN domain-containing protein [Actinophytocola sp.]|uniref:RICIN domain-containing protein n=1 Tax=Actinophytocola sp. TaxID=1872138 RepID=UPI002DDCFE66|nr:RICIN domain-containing protein [Actinophytocola sp.]HEV2781584.1 RICIN domain-containing protein [Actinophytocola sp.]
MKKTRALIAAMLLGAVTLLLAAPASAARPDPSPVGSMGIPKDAVSLKASSVRPLAAVHLWFADSLKCIDNPNYSTVSGTWLDQWSCVDQTNELWFLDYGFTAGGYDFFRIRNAYSGLCVNIQGGSGADGAPVIQYTCGDYANEYFVFWADANVPTPFYWVQAYSSGKVINVTGGDDANGAKLIQYFRCYCTNEYVALY